MTSLRTRNSESGFTLVELCVAIFIGVIVLTMAVTVLFSTYSSGTTLMSKEDVTSNTRQALLPILKSVGSAQSLLRCTVWKSSELQVEYETYLRRMENGGDDPTTPAVETGTPTFSGSSADCLEYYETGHVLLRVLPNSVCWFKDLSPGADGVIDYSKPFTAACLFRGGVGRDANYDGTGTDIGYSGASVIPMPCDPGPGNASDQDTLYYLECSYNNANMHYFVPSETVTGDWGLVPNSYRQVLDLGKIDSSSTHKRANIFSYTTIEGATPSFVNGDAGNNTGDILYVDVNMNVLYNGGTKTSDGDEVQKLYSYSQTVLLEGAQTYNDEGAYSDKFTG